MVVFVDANIPIHATGKAHPLRAHCGAALRAVAEGALDAMTSSEVLQEVLHASLRRPQRHRALEAFDEFRGLLRGRIVSIDESDIARARALAEEHPSLPGRDLVHLAVMHRHGVGTILTTDRHFDDIPGVTRIDPAEFASPA